MLHSISLHINNITNAFHGCGGRKSTRKWQLIWVFVDNATAVFVERENTNCRIEFQGKEYEKYPESAKIPHDYSDDEKTSGQIYHDNVID